ncbi:MAG: hypothetical protein HQ567_05540 [Candidatus Nealsonbacteria bacterium]|nr:hypothetical protein [Candidatus Nealsonbacteria bacterium]
MIRTILRRFLDHPARRWGIIIAILGIGLTTVLPAADELSRSRRDRAQLEEDSSRMRREVAALEDVRCNAKEEQQRLEELEAMAVTADQVPLFRQEIVDWARKAGCQVRRIRLESPRSQQWQEGDSLESTAAKRKKPDSSYVLKMQSLSVSVSGALPEVKRLLTQLHSTNRLIQCRKFSIAPSHDSRKEVVLNLELMLFDLSKAEVPR